MYDSLLNPLSRMFSLLAWTLFAFYVETASALSPGVGTYDDGHANWRYTGAWQSATEAGAYRGTFHASNAVGSFAQFAYSGQTFNLFFGSCPTCGIIKIFIDGRLARTVDSVSQQVLWKKITINFNQTNAAHNLKFVHAQGTMIRIDGIRINPATMPGCQLFPANHIWNTRVDGLLVHRLSSRWIASIGADTGLHMDFGSGSWQGGLIGIPYNLVSANQPLVTVRFDEYGDESDPGPYPVPANPAIEAGGDRHMLIVREGECKLYELYHAHKQGSTWFAGSGAIWDLNSNALRPSGWTSADAAGLAILPGLVRQDEVRSGRIEHALRFTASSTNGFIWPARHLTSGRPGALTDIPPMGARFRLKSSFDSSAYPRDLQVILKAMKEYGIILADNGSDWFISGAPDPRWDNDMLHLLDEITGSDFEAVDTSALLIDPDSAEVRPKRWNPAVGDSLQIQYSITPPATAIDLNQPVDIYNLDLFATTPSQINTLHAKGKKVMCYINAGAWENWRPDRSQFPAIVLGNNYTGWPGERWLDIRRIDLLRPIMRKRLDLCRDIGFDAVDPDNVNGFQNPSGFALTAEDQIRYNRWFANEAHARGLSIGLKNDSEQTPSLLDYFDWLLSEDCYSQGWCDDPNLRAFINARKPVFDIEYTDNNIDFEAFCAEVSALGHSGLLKNRELDGFFRACP